MWQLNTLQSTVNSPNKLLKFFPYFWRLLSWLITASKCILYNWMISPPKLVQNKSLDIQTPNVRRFHIWMPKTSKNKPRNLRRYDWKTREWHHENSWDSRDPNVLPPNFRVCHDFRFTALRIFGRTCSLWFLGLASPGDEFEEVFCSRSSIFSKISYNDLWYVDVMYYYVNKLTNII